MARLVTQIGKCAVKTLISHGRNELLGMAASRTSHTAMRCITTTQCSRAGKFVR